MLMYFDPDLHAGVCTNMGVHVKNDILTIISKQIKIIVLVLLYGVILTIGKPMHYYGYDCSHGDTKVTINDTMEAALRSLDTDQPLIVGMKVERTDATLILTELIQNGHFYPATIVGSSRNGHVILLQNRKLFYVVCQLTRVIKIPMRSCFEFKPVMIHDTKQLRYLDKVTKFLHDRS